MFPSIRDDYREPRDWLRPWRDRPGFFWPNCPCCNKAAQAYWQGGAIAGSISVITANKTDFGTETTSAVTSANLSQARFGVASVGNPATAAYTAGGTTSSPTQVATADKTTFSNDTTSAQTSANLSTARAEIAALSERSTKGYFAGGYTGNASGPNYTIIDKVTFSGDTTAALSAVLSQARGALAGISEGTSKGYFGGGDLTGSSSVKTADKITFSGDTCAAQTSAQLSTVRDSLQGGSDGSTHGYWVSGEDVLHGSIFQGYDKLTFSNDTTTTLSKILQRWGGASASDGNKLFIAAGNDAVSGTIAYVTKITFSNDTPTVIGGAGNLSQARFYLAGVSTVAL